MPPPEPCELLSMAVKDLRGHLARTGARGWGAAGDASRADRANVSRRSYVAKLKVQDGFISDELQDSPAATVAVPLKRWLNLS